MASLHPNLSGPYRVYVGLVPHGYLSSDAIRNTIREGLVFCDVKQHFIGNVVIKPDLTACLDPQSRYGFTHVEILRGVMSNVIHYAPSSPVTLLAHTHDLYTSKKNFKKTGYAALLKDFPSLSLVSDFEHYQLRYLLGKDSVLSLEERSHAATSPASKRYWSEVIAPQAYYNADCLIMCPKLKSSVFSQGFSGAIRLAGMGNLAATQYWDGHNVHNDRRIVDMLEIANPHLIVSDGIVTPIGGSEYTQMGQELGVILVANNALAHDLVAASLLHVNPKTVNHLTLAAERGWGPNDLAKVQLGGASSEALSLLQEKTKLWHLGVIQVQRFATKFEEENPGLKFPLEILVGPPYEEAGLQGLMLQWLYLSYDNVEKRHSINQWPHATLVLGRSPHYPQNHMVYVIGTQSIQAWHNLVSEERLLLKWGAISLWWARLKNSNTHLVWKLEGNPPSLVQLTRLFFMGSMGRMRPLFFSFFQVLRLLLQKTPRPPHISPSSTVKTADMPRNTWWAKP